MDRGTTRLSKFLASAGVASRRKADDIIKSGKVKVNDITVLDPYHQIDPYKDRVSIDNREIESNRDLVYVALYKPVGYLSDLKDTRERQLARDLVKLPGRLFPVGRLDYQSEGLMLFTNDGAFANRVMHPRYQVEKEYLAKLKGRMDERALKSAAHGLMVDGELYRFDKITLLRTETNNSWYRVIVHEGKNRMIRKLADVLNHPVLKLKRIRIGPVTLGVLKPGQFRHLTPAERRFFTPSRNATTTRKYPSMLHKRDFH